MSDYLYPHKVKLGTDAGAAELERVKPLYEELGRLQKESPSRERDLAIIRVKRSINVRYGKLGR